MTWPVTPPSGPKPYMPNSIRVGKALVVYDPSITGAAKNLATTIATQL
ncbi:MAG: hypothetical protein Q8N08_07055 [Methanobacteriaceae archaeon]|nr:hypothetical protein [Methanobacteriaceae archaeon]